MKFGIFYELSVPKPWDDMSSHRVYHEALEQIELADQLGFDQVWAVEHHFLEEFSHCSAPEIFLTAAAMRTKNIRIGQGIVLCLPPVNHPVRVAERAAVMDIVSDGRLEFGTGRASTWTELGGFGVDPDQTKEMWDECLHAFPKMWMQDVFSWDGKYFKFGPRNVVPKPVQKPHPPLWVAVSSPETAIQAAERGIGLLGVAFGSPKDQEERLKEYHRIIRDCEPVGAFVNDQVNTLNTLFCHEDDEYGFKLGSQTMASFQFLSNMLVVPKQVYPSRGYKYLGGALGSRAPSAGEAGSLVTRGSAVGNPEQIIKSIKMWEEVGVDRLCFFVSYGQMIPQEQVLQSMRLFAKEVMPKFGVKPPEDGAKAGVAPAEAAKKKATARA